MLTWSQSTQKCNTFVRKTPGDEKSLRKSGGEQMVSCQTSRLTEDNNIFYLPDDALRQQFRHGGGNICRRIICKVLSQLPPATPCSGVNNGKTILSWTPRGVYRRNDRSLLCTDAKTLSFPSNFPLTTSGPQPLCAYYYTLCPETLLFPFSIFGVIISHLFFFSVYSLLGLALLSTFLLREIYHLSLLSSLLPVVHLNCVNSSS